MTQLCRWRWRRSGSLLDTGWAPIDEWHNYTHQIIGPIFNRSDLVPPHPSAWGRDKKNSERNTDIAKRRVRVHSVVIYRVLSRGTFNWANYKTLPSQAGSRKARSKPCWQLLLFGFFFLSSLVFLVFSAGGCFAFFFLMKEEKVTSSFWAVAAEPFVSR